MDTNLNIIEEEFEHGHQSKNVKATLITPNNGLNESSSSAAYSRMRSNLLKVAESQR